MKVDIQVTIDAPINKTFDVFSDIENAEFRIKGIDKIEILSDKKSGLGLEWRETRTMFGKEATEEMEITQFESPKMYEVKADSHGAKYTSTYTFTAQGDDQTVVNLVFSAEPYKLSAKIFTVMGYIFKGATKKAFLQDMEDLKKYLEN